MKRRLQHLAGETGEIRTASFRGATHLVVPVVALVEGVVRPANSEGPELALASEFGHTPEGWNGRPVMVGHPRINGLPVSAGDPRILESGSIGQTFQAAIEDRKLKLEAWINEAQARELGGDAEAIVDRLRAGERLEVSVGVFIDLEESEGEHQGREFSAVWRHVIPDHLAMLREGDIGACSIQMGCGAPRAAARKPGKRNANGTGGRRRPEAELEAELGAATDETVYERLVKKAKALLGVHDAISDVDRREQLEIALRDSENDFLGIVAVLDDRTVVYHAWAEGGGIRMFQRSFRVRGDRVALAEDKQEVRSETSFISIASAKCQCGKPVSSNGGEVPMKDKKQRVQALIDDKKTPWAESDREYLVALSDERLAAFEQHGTAAGDSSGSSSSSGDGGTGAAGAGNAQPAPSKETATPAAAGTPEPVKPKTPEELEAEYLKDAPESIRTMVASHKAADAKRKGELVSVLKAAQDAYSEDELKALSVEELERLVRVAKADAPPPDYSGRGVPRQDDEPEVRALTWADFKPKDKGGPSQAAAS